MDPTKQNKSATEVYEQATNCPVAGGMGRIWAEYAQFLEERGKPRTAQKIYLRALVGEERMGPDARAVPRVNDPTDQNMLWNAFLCMMRTLGKKPELTMEELKRAAIKEHLGQSLTDVEDKIAIRPVPDHPVSASPALFELPNDEMTVARPAKRSRWDSQSPVEVESVNAGSIDAAAGILFSTSVNMPSEIETLWLARDGGALPSRPEPPLFTASPPKLGDPCGKDLVGNETALKILKLLTVKTHDGKCLGSTVLDLCHACWMMTAIKEEEVVQAQESLLLKIVSICFCLLAIISMRN